MVSAKLPTEKRYYTPIDVGCRFIETKIMSEAVLDHLKNANTQFATVDDAASALLRIVADKSIHGMSSTGSI